MRTAPLKIPEQLILAGKKHVPVLIIVDDEVDFLNTLALVFRNGKTCQ